jgi:hypothetical protein
MEIFGLEGPVDTDTKISDKFATERFHLLVTGPRVTLNGLGFTWHIDFALFTVYLFEQ